MKMLLRQPLLILLAGLLLQGCYEERKFLEIGIPAQGDKTFAELNPVDDMQDQVALKAQEEEMMMPPPMAVDRNHRSYPEAFKADKTLAKGLKNPVAMSTQSLKRGQDLYMTYCVVCHGERGMGNGTIIPKFPKPPSLTSRTSRVWTDGDFYHVISAGQNNVMPSYANQMRPMERWAVVNYIRALQRAEHPKQPDIDRLSKR